MFCISFDIASNLKCHKFAFFIYFSVKIDLGDKYAVLSMLCAVCQYESVPSSNLHIATLDTQVTHERHTASGFGGGITS